jgi:hypothetical protein
MQKLLPVAEGTSQIHLGWESTLTFSHELESFVELSGGPPDVRGNSDGDACEVDDEYAKRVYGKTRADVPKPA